MKDKRKNKKRINYKNNDKSFGKILFKKDIARRISEKYKNLSILDAEYFIDIFLNEIYDAVIEDKCTIDLHRICKIGIKRCPKFGYDFETNEHFRGEDIFKIFCKPNNYIRVQASKISERIPESIGE